MSPQRQIRALFDKETITVYQAYNEEIAAAAVQAQRLSASPAFKYDRMTWIKPSWCWMMYRCGYSYKDKNQSRVLAIRMKHESFRKMLEQAQLAHETHNQGTTVVQWDPERGPRVERLEYRSIQIGLPAALTRQWIDEWIDGIADVTEQARAMKKVLDKDPGVDVETLVNLGLMPHERPYQIDDRVVERLQMT